MRKFNFKSSPISLLTAERPFDPEDFPWGGSEVIHVLTGSPGTGKTLGLLKPLAEQLAENEREDYSFRVGYFSKYHKLLNELEGRLPNNVLAHWKGFTKKCPRYGDDRVVDFLYDDLGLSPRLICDRCDPKECEYQDQFKTKKPIILLPKAYVRAGGGGYFDTLIWDELNLEVEEIKEPDWGKLKREITSLFSPSFFKKLSRAKNMSSKIKFCLTHFKHFKSRLGRRLKATRITKLNNSVKRRLRKVSDLFHRLERGIKWLKYFKIHGERRSYGEPDLFHLFQAHLNGATVILVDATVPWWAIRKLHARWFLEGREVVKKGGFIPNRLLFNFYVKEWKENTNSRIVEVNSPFYGSCWYPRVSLSSSGVKNAIVNRIKMLLRLHQDEALGLISLKGEEFPLKGDLQPSTKMNIKVGHYGALRGSNKFLECDIGFVVGSYNLPPWDLRRNYCLLFPDEPKPKPKTKPKKRGEPYKFKHKSLERLQRHFTEKEMYHAFHRFRFLQNNRTIYAFCYVPEELKEETSYESIKDVESYVRSEKIKRGLKNVKVDIKKWMREEGIEKIWRKKLVEKLREKVGIGYLKARRKIKEAVERDPDLEIKWVSGGRGRPRKYVLLKAKHIKK